MSFLSNIFGSKSEKEIKKIKPIVDKILNLEEEYKNLSDKDLQNKTIEFKDRYNNGESLDSFLPEAFATVREASTRVLGMKHYPVQLYGGVVLHQGRIAELATGEGKTLVATCPAYLNAITGNSVMIVTVNDYLAKRDSQWMGKIYKFLGMSVGLIVHDMTPFERQEAYRCDIVYGTNNEIGFDYLRDNMAYNVSEIVQRDLGFAIVDEVDSILIDEARTPLIISGFSGETDDGYKKADEFVRSLKGKILVELDENNTLDQAAQRLIGEDVKEKYSEYDYIVEEKNKSVMLTEQGTFKAEQFYGIDNLGDIDNIEIMHYITRSLRAHGLFKKDVDYVISDGKIVIVDESTGRLMPGRRYNEGIHQAIEAKENVEVQQESKTMASITFQNLFRKFEKLSGMTGTAMTEEEEFRVIYNLDIVSIPTNKPVVRVDHNDIVYTTRQGKLKEIIKMVKKCHDKGQPILIGTVSVEKSEELHRLLDLEGIDHNVLNAKYHEQEAKIIAQAGKFNAVTVATNMAGRGTDIILGGNSEYLALEELRNEGFSEELIVEANSFSNTDDEEILNIRKLYKEKEDRIKLELESERQKVIAAGGLFILGTERHESRRIDNQLRGRSGRQGDVGESLFVLSLEDDLMRLFGAHNLVNIANQMSIPETIPIDLKFLSNGVEKAQKRIESKYYEIRKNTLQYDDILAKQRDVIYSERKKLLLGEMDYVEVCKKMMKDIIERKIFDSIPNEKYLNEIGLGYIKENLENILRVLDLSKYDSNISKIKIEDFVIDIQSQILEHFLELLSTKDGDFIKDFCRKLLFFLIDNSWQDQMVSMDELKKGVGIRAYGQVDPLEGYRKEGFELFDNMMNYIREEVLNTFMSLYYTNIIEVNLSIGGAVNEEI